MWCALADRCLSACIVVVWCGTVILKMCPDWYLSKVWTSEVRRTVQDIAAQQAAVAAAGGDPSTVDTHVNQVLMMRCAVDASGARIAATLCVGMCVAGLQLGYIKVYALLVLVLVVFRLVEGFVFIQIALRASLRLHDSTFARVLNGTLAYFDTTPLGRILNRFSGV